MVQAPLPHFARLGREKKKGLIRTKVGTGDSEARRNGDSRHTLSSLFIPLAPSGCCVERGARPMTLAGVQIQHHMTTHSLVCFDDVPVLEEVEECRRAMASASLTCSVGDSNPLACRAWSAWMVDSFSARARLKEGGERKNQVRVRLLMPAPPFMPAQKWPLAPTCPSPGPGVRC